MDQSSESIPQADEQVKTQTGAACSLCGHVSTQADPVQVYVERHTTWRGRRPIDYWVQVKRCSRIFACDERQAQNRVREEGLVW